MSIVRAVESFAAFTDAGVVGVTKDEAFEHNDPIVKARPHMFKSDADETPKRRGRPPKVEQATANPGEFRDVPPAA